MNPGLSLAYSLCTTGLSAFELELERIIVQRLQLGILPFGILYKGADGRWHTTLTATLDQRLHCLVNIEVLVILPDFFKETIDRAVKGKVDDPILTCRGVTLKLDRSVLLAVD